MTENSATPAVPARLWPVVTHAGQDRWHTLCETCEAEVSGLSVGGAVSAHAAHVTRAHGANRDTDGYCTCDAIDGDHDRPGCGIYE